MLIIETGSKCDGNCSYAMRICQSYWEISSRFGTTGACTRRAPDDNEAVEVFQGPDSAARSGSNQYQADLLVLVLTVQQQSRRTSAIVGYDDR